MKKIVLALVSGVLFPALFFTGCKNKSSGAAQAGEQKRLIQVGTIIGEGPYSYTDENDNSIGYSIDVIKEVFKLLPQYELKFVPYTGLDGLLSGQSGKFQIVADRKFWTEERAKNFLIPSEPFGAVENGIIYRSAEKHKFGTLADIGKNNGRLVPMTPSAGNYPIIVEWNEKNPDLKIKLEQADKMETSIPIGWILENRYDVFLSNHDKFIQLVESEGGQYYNYRKQLGWTTINATKIYPLFNKNEQQLFEDYNKAFKTISDNGTLKKISYKWFNSDVFELLD